MLYFDASFEIAGLVCHRDFNVPSRFYYLPRSPRLSLEQGEPLFQLIIYREAATGPANSRGGGYLTMTVDLGVPEGIKETVRSELSRRYGVEATLAPIPVERGAVRLVTLGATSGAQDAAATGPRFVEEIMGSSTPSLYGDERAVFQVELTQRGATLMRQAVLAGGASPVVVLYDLDFRGLNPAYELKIKIKFTQSYQYLRTRAQMNTLWFKTDIDREMEALQKQGGIDIQVVDYASTQTDPEKLTAEREKLVQLARELASWSFFKPGLNPGQVLAQDRGNLTIYDPTADARADTTGFTQSQTKAALTGVGASSDVAGPRLQATAVRGGQPASQTQQSEGQTQTQPAKEEPMSAVEAWNRAGRPQGAYSLRDLSQDERQEISFDLRQTTASIRTIAPQGQIRLIGNTEQLRQRILEVDLDDSFFQTLKGDVTTTADLEGYGIATMTVNVRYGTRPNGSRYKDTASFQLDKAGDTHKYEFSLDHLKSQKIEYQVVLDHTPGVAIGVEATREESPWIETATLHIEPDPRTVSNLFVVNLVTAGVDWNQVRLVEARLRYDDPGSGLSVSRNLLLRQATPEAKVVVRPKDKNKDSYRVECKFHYTQGGEDTTTLTGRGPDTVVLNQPPDQMAIVRVTFADPLDKYSRLVAELDRPAAAGGFGERTSLTFQGNMATSTWAFRRNDAKDIGYKYKVTAFAKDGSVREAEWTDGVERELIVGDKTEGVLHLEAILGIDIKSLGYRAMRLKLEYPAAPSWADRDVEKLFQTGQEQFIWKVPMADVNAKTYRWQATWYTSDGKQIVMGPFEAQDELLILPLPER